MPNRIMSAVCAIFIALTCAMVANAQQRPLITEDVDIIAPGSLRVSAAVDFVQKARFPVSGLTGDLTRAGVINVSIGLAPNVEVQIEGVAQNLLSINTRGASAIPLSLAANANSTNDIGDFMLWTKIKLRNETAHLPSVGIGILTAPTAFFTQNDVLTYGLAGIVRLNKQFSLAGEVNGRTNTRPGSGPLGTESQGEARVGMQVRASGLRFDFAGIKGLTNFSPHSGITVGVTYDSPSILKPVK